MLLEQLRGKGLIYFQLYTLYCIKHCISCANGTDALQLMLQVWGIGNGDAVFVPDFTFFASGEVVSF
ncbi:MAG: DegT/DnrJ/EryC1/StrS family aminotransferase, partial [Alistipes sp.]|nr:DegT/DnrJ/EryC1/StrS family aminotransferase [Alistipes sp.]